MSPQHVATPWRWAIVGSDLDPTANHVLLVVSLFTDETGVCDPSRQTIAELTGRSVDTVDRALRRAEAAGLVKIKRTHGRTRNSYYVAFPTAAPVRLLGGRQQPQDQSPTAANRASNSRTDAARTRRTSELGGARCAADALKGAAASAPVEDECGRCGKRLPLVDDIYCVPCKAKLVADQIVDGVRRAYDAAAEEFAP